MSVVLGGVLFADAVHHAGAVGVFAENPVKLVGGVFVGIPGVVNFKGVGCVSDGGGETCDSSVFSLPPVAAFVVVRYEETVLNFVSGNVGLTGVPEGVLDAVRDTDEPVVVLLDGVVYRR